MHADEVLISAESDIGVRLPWPIGCEGTNPSTWIDGCGAACRNTEPAQCLPFTGTDWGVWVQAVGECGVAAAGAPGADGGGQGAAGSG